MPRKPLIIIHPDTKEELSVEQAAALVRITPGAMRRRLSDPKWNLRKALTQKSDWSRSKNTKNRKPPDFVTTVKVPESLCRGGNSPNAVIKEVLATIDKLTPVVQAESVKQVRIALTKEERDRLHWLMLEGKLPNLTAAVAALLNHAQTISTII